MRLDKFLSHNGFGSRKDVKAIVKKKRVKINDTLVLDAATVLDVDIDKVSVDEILIAYTHHAYFMLNKPAGYECSHIENNYPSVLQLIHETRNDLIMVGRLDADTEGLLIITNDGQFSHTIASGKKDVAKTYYVELDQPFDEQFIPILASGLPFEEGFLKPAHVKQISEKSIELSIYEGKYHQVKRMMHACNNEVTYLKRIAIGDLKLDTTLELGAYRTLSEAEIRLFSI